MNGFRVSPFFLQLAGGKFSLREHLVPPPRHTRRQRPHDLALRQRLAVGSTAFNSPWTAGSATLIEAGTHNQGPVDFVKGQIDDVHFYNGLSPALRSRTSPPAEPTANQTVPGQVDEGSPRPGTFHRTTERVDDDNAGAPGTPPLRGSPARRDPATHGPGMGRRRRRPPRRSGRHRGGATGSRRQYGDRAPSRAAADSHGRGSPTSTASRYRYGSSPCTWRRNGPPPSPTSSRSTVPTTTPASGPPRTAGGPPPTTSGNTPSPTLSRPPWFCAWHTSNG